GRTERLRGPGDEVAGCFRPAAAEGEAGRDECEEERDMRDFEMKRSHRSCPRPWPRAVCVNNGRNRAIVPYSEPSSRVNQKVWGVSPPSEHVGSGTERQLPRRQPCSRVPPVSTTPHSP